MADAATEIVQTEQRVDGHDKDIHGIQTLLTSQTQDLKNLTAALAQLRADGNVAGQQHARKTDLEDLKTAVNRLILEVGADRTNAQQHAADLEALTFRVEGLSLLNNEVDIKATDSFYAEIVKQVATSLLASLDDGDRLVSSTELRELFRGLSDDR